MLAPVAEAGIANGPLLTELRGRQTAITLLIYQGMPLFRCAVLSHGGNLLIGK